MTKVDISNLSGLKFKIWLHVCSNLNTYQMNMLKSIREHDFMKNHPDKKIKKAMLDMIYETNSTTTLQSICDALPDYTKNHISKDLRWLVDKKLITRHTADNNFKKGFYFAAVDEVVFLHALATSLEKLKPKKHNTEIHVSIADMQYVLYNLVCDNTNLDISRDLNIESLHEYFTDVIFPLLIVDDTWKSKDNFGDEFHHKLETDQLPKLVLKLTNARKDYVTYLKDHFIKSNKDWKQ